MNYTRLNHSILKNIIYRKLESNESQKYRLIRLESLKEFPASFGSTSEEQNQRDKLAFENFIVDSNPECFIVGAFDEGTLIGICGFYRHKDDRYNHRGEIIQMYVQSNYQGKQIGFNLLKETVVQAFNIETLEQIELEVLTDIKSANRIYEKLGFQECGLKHKFHKIEGVYADQRQMILLRSKYIQ